LLNNRRNKIEDWFFVIGVMGLIFIVAYVAEVMK